MNPITRCLASAVASLLLAAISQIAYAIDVKVELNPDPVTPGGTLRADITISNDSSSPVALVPMEAPVPAGVTEARSSLDRLVGGSQDLGRKRGFGQRSPAALPGPQ